MLRNKHYYMFLIVFAVFILSLLLIYGYGRLNDENFIIFIISIIALIGMIIFSLFEIVIRGHEEYNLRKPLFPKEFFEDIRKRRKKK